MLIKINIKFIKVRSFLLQNNWKQKPKKKETYFWIPFYPRSALTNSSKSFFKNYTKSRIYSCQISSKFFKMRSKKLPFRYLFSLLWIRQKPYISS